MTVFEKEKAIGDLLNAVRRTLKEWYIRYAPGTPDAPYDDRFLYALHTLRYAEQLADQFMRADRAGRLAMRADIERLDAEIRIIAAAGSD